MGGTGRVGVVALCVSLLAGCISLDGAEADGTLRVQAESFASVNRPCEYDDDGQMPLGEWHDRASNNRFVSLPNNGAYVWYEFTLVQPATVARIGVVPAASAPAEQHLNVRLTEGDETVAAGSVIVQAGGNPTEFRPEATQTLTPGWHRVELHYESTPWTINLGLDYFDLEGVTVQRIEGESYADKSTTCTQNDNGESIAAYERMEADGGRWLFLPDDAAQATYVVTFASDAVASGVRMSCSGIEGNQVVTVVLRTSTGILGRARGLCWDGGPLEAWSFMDTTILPAGTHRIVLSFETLSPHTNLNVDYFEFAGA